MSKATKVLWIIFSLYIIFMFLFGFIGLEGVGFLMAAYSPHAFGVTILVQLFITTINKFNEGLHGEENAK